MPRVSGAHDPGQKGSIHTLGFIPSLKLLPQTLLLSFQPSFPIPKPPGLVQPLSLHA